MAIPWREVKSQFQSVFLTSISQFTDNISFSVLIRRLADVVVSPLKRPKTEAIMVFGRQNHPFHACSNKRLCPLLTVETGRIKRLGIRIPIPPFAIIKSVQPKVDEGIGLHLLPGHLFGFWNREHCLWRCHLSRCTRCQPCRTGQSRHPRKTVLHV